jgi:phage-related protein
VKDAWGEWRIIYRIDLDAILVVDVFQKKTRETPLSVIGNCRKRLREYDVISES